MLRLQAELRLRALLREPRAVRARGHAQGQREGGARGGLFGDSAVRRPGQEADGVVAGAADDGQSEPRGARCAHERDRATERRLVAGLGDAAVLVAEHAGQVAVAAVRHPARLPHRHHDRRLSRTPAGPAVRGGVRALRDDPGLRTPRAGRARQRAQPQLVQDSQVPEVQLALQVSGDARDPHEGEAPGGGDELYILHSGAAAPAPSSRRDVHLRLQTVPVRGVQLLDDDQRQPQHTHAIGQAFEQHAGAAERRGAEQRVAAGESESAVDPPLARK